MFGLIVAGRLVSNTVIVKVLSLGEMSLFYCGTFLFRCGNVVWDCYWWSKGPCFINTCHVTK